MTEADTCREFVTPKLVAAGWSSAPRWQQEQGRPAWPPRSAGNRGTAAGTAPGNTAVPRSCFWPIYNLDLKNPHAKAGLEHADPKDLVAAMRSHETEVMRLLGEIEALVAEVRQ